MVQGLSKLCLEKESLFIYLLQKADKPSTPRAVMSWVPLIRARPYNKTWMKTEFPSFVCKVIWRNWKTKLKLRWWCNNVKLTSFGPSFIGVNPCVSRTYLGIKHKKITVLLLVEHMANELLKRIWEKPTLNPPPKSCKDRSQNDGHWR